jgi:hypothetical protein
MFEIPDVFLEKHIILWVDFYLFVLGDIHLLSRPLPKVNLCDPGILV